MTELITEGFYLMLIGMGFVLAFLSLVVLALYLLAFFVPKEEPVGTSIASAKVVSNGRLIAVIGAAIHQYRNQASAKRNN